ncbi:MAG: TetR/AcrR family transcriptional regulator [Actinobacteria bacterium]|nr:TetR/AcrR family transcriptional regulator [Actinomycetota bacterium]
MTTAARAPLSRAAIVDATIELIGTSGAEAFTMRRLGEVLHADATAVYRHFRDKGELLRAVGDRLLGDATDGIDADDDWRTIVVTVCSRVREALLQHPHLAASVRDAPPLAEAEFAITETLLQQFLRAGLSPRAAALAYHSTIELTVGSATIDAAVHSLEPADRDARYQQWRQAYAALPQSFAASRRVASHLYRGSASDRFATALRQLLDGIVPPP